jgi:type VI protein secretion system component VasK
MIFGVLLVEPLRVRTGWDWYSMGWAGTLTLTAAIIALNLAAGVAWQKIRQQGDRAWKIQRTALIILGVWFLAGGWLSYFHFRKSPELAREPYPFLNAARVRKGLSPTPDGLSQDPLEVVREKVRRKLKLSADEQRMLESRS